MAERLAIEAIGMYQDAFQKYLTLLFHHFHSFLIRLDEMFPQVLQQGGKCDKQPGERTICCLVASSDDDSLPTSRDGEG
jgi:hypothetical protein